jgi:hypothetical protein
MPQIFNRQVLLKDSPESLPMARVTSHSTTRGGVLGVNRLAQKADHWSKPHSVPSISTHRSMLREDVSGSSEKKMKLSSILLAFLL